MIPFYPVKPIRGGRPLDGLYQQLAGDLAWTCQAKLNGKRALWDGNVLWSREGNVLAAPRVTRALAGFPFILDGELTGSGDRAVFHAFDFPDVPDAATPLRDRLVLLRQCVPYQRVPSGIVRLLPLDVTWNEVEFEGWEGVVFKKLSSPYPKADRPDVETPSWVKYRKEWQ